MSYVTTAILTCSIMDDDKLDAVNDWMKTDETVSRGGGGFNDVGEHVGGTKAPQACIWAGAFNYLDEKRLVERLGAIKWDHPEAVCLMLNREHDYGFAQFRMVDGTEVNVLAAAEDQWKRDREEKGEVES